ncbi:PREDICTED: uncharacterized protein LOC106812180 [Priapulus caudatus]|uniref:Uncharacterized protein LOC106812180 n=1 Tax=Priapulus caudatus TaxID=37621 RepID=A0ABM1EH18_PRICU|nr:PREDICTED: uncharacterized protein LOC106812180 [Priapulus caudatus]
MGEVRGQAAVAGEVRGQAAVAGEEAAEDEVEKEMMMVIRRFARESGVTQRDVIINVYDDNQARPLFTNAPYPFRAVLSPEAASYEVVYILSAEGAAGAGDIRYTLELDYNSSGIFEVDPVLGYVRTTVANPFTFGDEYVLRVSAKNVSADDQTQGSLELYC